MTARCVQSRNILRVPFVRLSEEEMFFSRTKAGLKTAQQAGLKSVQQAGLKSVQLQESHCDSCSAQAELFYTIKNALQLSKP